ncbi:unnamed protein product [Lymnaea stagnalis]|uniref:Uncharacterized protein n=1 Tax=Lymnaea stagnalis TaxID=6523 RepID=A0AAV2I173_LYMST
MGRQPTNLALALTVLFLFEHLAVMALADPAPTPDAKSRAFQQAIESCSDKCKFAIAACLQASPGAQKLMAQEKYCDVMNYSDQGVSVYDCLVKSLACTDDEFNKLKHVACGASSLHCGYSGMIETFFSLGNLINKWCQRLYLAQAGGARGPDNLSLCPNNRQFRLSKSHSKMCNARLIVHYYNTLVLCYY